MFFAYLALRPALAAEEALARARLWAQVLRRFFPWVWACVAVLLLTGFYLIIAVFNGPREAPDYVWVMAALGVTMMALFAHVFFAPYRKLQRGLARGDAAVAQQAMAAIGRIMAVNLALGLGVIIVAMLGGFSPFN